MREAVEVRAEYYIDDTGNSPFVNWVERLDRNAAKTVERAITKRERGITGVSESVGGGVHELKADGFRIYYGLDGPKLIILLGGGTKKRQQADIDAAMDRWRNYKARKESRQRD